MEGPSPGLHNLCFEDATSEHPARATFTYYEGSEQKEMVLTIAMVRKHMVNLEHAEGERETFFVTCECTTLYLDTQNHSLFRQWAHRNGVPLGSQLLGK